MAAILSLLPFQPLSSSHVIVTDHPYVAAGLLALGAFTFAKFLAKFCGVLLQTFVLPGTNLKKYGAGKGAWAVITGASEGIGREFGLQLAKKGFNVLLISRDPDRLNVLCDEIEKQSASSGRKVQARALFMDFCQLGGSQWQTLQETIDSIDVGVLINNVGKSHAFPADFLDAPEQEVDQILTININSTVKVTRTVLPNMIKRRRGLIITMASFAGVSIVSPMLAPYAASKVFLASFNAALQEEVRGKGIDIETLDTYFVVSAMSKVRRASAMVPMPKQFVQSALAKVGLPCGALWTGRPTVSSPYWSHALLDWLMHFVGWTWLFGRFAHITHIDIRRRALRKLEREAKKQ